AEVVDRDGRRAAHTRQPDGLIGIAIDRHQRVGADVGDRHAAGEGRGPDAEAGKLDQVLAARRRGVEVGDAVVAEAGPEYERVVAGAAGQQIDAEPALDTVVAAGAGDRVAAGAADQAVGVAVAGEGVAARAADHILERTQDVRADRRSAGRTRAE